MDVVASNRSLNSQQRTEVTFRKFHDCGWKNSFHTSADVAMLGYGFGFSMYPQFFVEYLKTYQMLPRPYMRSFHGEPDNQILKQK